MRLALAAIGFTALIGQLILIRELVAVFYGNELVFGLILASWLLWGAIGSWGLGRLVDRSLGHGAYLAGLALAAAFLPIEMVLVRTTRTLLGVTPGAFVDFGAMIGSILLILAPLCATLGALFTLGSQLLAQRGGTVGQAYVYESAGAVIGGILFSFALVPVLDPFQIAIAVGAINLAVGAIVVGTKKIAALCASTAVFLGLLALPLGSSLHSATLNWQWTDITFAHDSVYGRLIITARDSQRVFFENGLLMFETQSTFPEEVIHFPLLEHPRPRTILLIGGGAGGSLREALKHPVDQVRYVELDPALIEAARSQLPPGDRAAFDDPRAVVTLVDGRLYVKTSNQRFDVIIVDLPEPSTGQLNRFYTEEFFREAKALLNEGGILSLGLPAAENYLNPEIRRRNGSVYHTLRAVFPYVLVLPGDHNFFLASDAPLSTDPPVLIRRLKERNIATRYVHEAYITYIFTTDRFRSTQESLERAEPVKLNRDLVPICYFYDMVLWLSMFYSNLNDLFYAASLLNLPWLIVPAILMVLWLRRRPLAVPIVIGLTGFAGITLEVVILLAFQSLRGYIYHEVSLIAAAFMLGTALGGAAMNQALVRTSPTVRWLAVVQIAILLYAIALPTALAGAASLPLTRNLADLIFPTLMGLAGFLGGLEFPVAVALTQGSTRRVDAPAPILDRGTPVGAVASVAGLLYGADLLGACFGAILASVLLIPLLGIPQTCGIVGFLSLLGLSLLVP